MNNLQNLKFGNTVAPVLVNGGTATVDNVIDTAGYSNIGVLFIFGALAASLSAVKLQESDTNNGSDWVDIAGAAFTVTGTDDRKLYLIDISHEGGRMRYINVVLTAGAGDDLVAALALFDEPVGNFPKSATTRGLAGYIQI